MTYLLDQGNKHHQKLLEVMDSSCSNKHKDLKQQVNTAWMAMMHIIIKHKWWSWMSQ